MGINIYVVKEVFDLNRIIKINWETILINSCEDGKL